VYSDDSTVSNTIRRHPCGDGVVTRSPRKKNPVAKLKLLMQLASRARER
jgi:hypothetical protein